MTKHLGETENHIYRPESVFDSIVVEVESKKRETTAGLIKEAEEIMESTERGVVRDAGIISAAQKLNIMKLLRTAHFVLSQKHQGKTKRHLYCNKL